MSKYFILIFLAAQNVDSAPNRNTFNNWESIILPIGNSQVGTYVHGVFGSDSQRLLILLDVDDCLPEALASFYHFFRVDMRIKQFIIFNIEP